MNREELRRRLDQSMVDLTPKDENFDRIEQEAEKRIQKQKIARKLYQKYGIAAAAALVLTLSLSAGILGLFNRGQTAGVIDDLETITFTVSAEKESSAGIAVDSGFTITSDRDVAPEVLKQYIRLFPETEFTLKKQDSGKYYMSAGTLNAGQLVTISLVSESGRILKSAAFQTEQTFRVVSTYPTDGYPYTSITTGIEVKFSYPDVESYEYEKYFSINPQVQGRFEKHGPTLSFVPTQSLESGKTYQITLKAGLSSPTGRALKEDYTFSFKTSQGERTYGITGRATETFLPDDNPLVEVYAKAGNLNNKYSATVYRFPDTKSYQEMLTKYLLEQRISEYGRWNDIQDDLPTDGLQSYMSYTGQFACIRSEYERDYGYAVLPDLLPQGWYLVKIKTAAPDGNAIAVQKLLQISPLSVYTVTAHEDVCFWINDTKTGKPVPDASITLQDFGMSGQTDKNGTLTLRKGEKAFEATKDDSKNPNSLMVIQSGGQVYIDIHAVRGEYTYHDADSDQIQKVYYSALYTDRAAYLPTDTIRVWGVLRARDGKTSPPDGLTLQFGPQTIPVTIAKDGSFTAEIKFEDQVSGGFSVHLMKGQTYIASKSVSILDYDKPSYVIEASTDSWFYTDPNAQIKLNVKGSFFDGTPADGLNVAANYYRNSSNDVYTASLDENGSAEIKIPVGDNPDNYWSPVYARIDVNSKDAENTYQYSFDKPVFLFLRDIMLESESKVVDKKPMINITTSKIDTSRLSQDEPGVWSNDLIRGAPADVDITLTAQRTWYEKVDLGTYYDYVRKTTFHQYKYFERKDTPITLTLKTTGGKLVYNDLPPLQGNDYYAVTYSYNDSKGRPITEYDYLFSEIFREYRQGKMYMFETSRNSQFKLSDEPLQLQLKENGLNVPPTESSRILTVLNQSNILSTTMTSGTTVTVKPDASMIPNCNITGAYFDGRYVNSIENLSLYYDSSERELDIQIQTDKKTYNTKEKAKATIIVNLDGKPVKDASLLVSVVDEAALAVEDNEYQLLNTLYRRNYNIRTARYTSYIYHDMNKIQYWGEGGEGGEGESEGVRKDFMDTALFTTVKTDTAGKATAEISLPDNLTEWRITVLGYDPAMNAGQSQAGIKVSRDFFISPIIASQFLTGDDVVFSVRSYGAKAKDNTVEYTATLAGDKTAEKKISGKAKSNTVFSFGKLPAGSYTITLLGKLGSDSDGVELPFRVVESGTEFYQSTPLGLNKINIQPTRYPVSISLYNEEFTFFNQLLDLLVSAPPLRGDEKVASVFGAELIAQMSGASDESYKELKKSLTGYHSFSEYDASSPDPTLNARIAAAASSYCPNLAFYFDGVLGNKNSTRLDIAASYMGLAALKQPVLNDLRYLVNREELSNMERLYIIAGLALIGDTDNAQKAYETYIKPNLIPSKDEKNKTCYLYSDSGQDWAYRNTALSLMAASAVGAPEAEGLARTLLAAHGDEDLYYTEFMVYLTYFRDAKGGNTATVSYQKDGKTQTVTLGREPVMLTFDKDGFQKANFRVESGKVGANAYYYGIPQVKENSKGLIITKSITPVQDANLKTGDLILVTLTVETPDSDKYQSFQVNDYLPSGFRYLYTEYTEYMSGRTSYLIRQEKQKLNFQITTNPYTYRGSVRYYARAVLPGEYTVDSAYLTGSLGQYALTQKSTITIHEK